MALSASLAPSGNFNLSNFYLTLPVDSTGGITGTALAVKNLAGYTAANMFWTGSDGAMTFRANVDGATTSGSSYARSELREMNGTSLAAWNLTTGGSMAATLEVDQVPIRFDGSLGKVVVGQIHGANDELVRLYWDAGKMYFANDLSGSDNTEHKFYFTDANGNQPNVSLNEKFSYTISAHGSALEVDIYADGQVYRSTTAINSIWQSDNKLYFKAGVYLGVNETGGTGSGQTSFYDLRFTHSGPDLTPVLSPTSSTTTTTAPVTSTTTPTTTTTAPTTTTTAPTTTTTTTATGLTVNGTDAGNLLYGGDNNDVIHSGLGNDTIWGHAGNDGIWGEGGNDMLYGEAGVDTIYGGDGSDWLIGGTGADVLYGQGGADVFKFSGLSDSTRGSVDVIKDWSAADGDRISLSAIDANKLLTGDQAFKFIGTMDFGHQAGELHYYQSNGSTFVEGDVNGDAIGDFLIQIQTATALTSANFIL